MPLPVSSSRRTRLLAIDDEPAMLEWLRILLESTGAEVRTAKTGAAGDEVFRA